MNTAHRLTALLAVVALAMLPARASEPKENKAEAEEFLKLQGLWEVESVTLYGRARPKKDPPNRETVKDSIITVVSTKAMWAMTLDVTTNPKRVTLTEVEMGKDGKPAPKKDAQTNYCVYELKGDTLTTVAWRGPKAEFPKSVTPDGCDP